MIKELLLVALLMAPTSSLTLDKTTCFAPCKFNASVKVVPQSDDRAWELDIDGENYSTLTTRGIEEHTVLLPLRIPYPGDYIIRLRVYSSTMKITFAAEKSIEVKE